MVVAFGFGIVRWECYDVIPFDRSMVCNGVPVAAFIGDGLDFESRWVRSACQDKLSAPQVTRLRSRLQKDKGRLEFDSDSTSS